MKRALSVPEARVFWFCKKTFLARRRSVSCRFWEFFIFAFLIESDEALFLNFVCSLFPGKVTLVIGRVHKKCKFFFLIHSSFWVEFDFLYFFMLASKKHFSYLLLLSFSLTMGCRPGGQEASAHAPKPKTEFGGDRTFHPVTLPYIDTNSASWKVVRARLDSFYTTQTRIGFNGSVLVGYKGHVLYERYFGWADKGAQKPWSPTTPSQLASTSKTYTGTAILYLYQRGYLNLDAKVKEYIPSFPYTDLTVRMLLSHRTGLPDYLKWVQTYRKGNAPLYNPELMELFAKHKPALEFKPNTRFKYSNSNYAVLASVIEAVTETKYADFMKDYIFNAVGLKKHVCL